MRTTLYDVLGIEPGASPAEVGAAYEAKKAALAEAMDATSQNELKLARDAHAILSDPAKRAQYDQRLKAEVAQEHRITSYEAAPERGGALKWLVIAAIVAAGYFAYERMHPHAAPTPAQTGEAAPEAAPVPATAPVEPVPAAPAVQATAAAAAPAPADVRDAKAVPITPAQRNAYLDFLSQPLPRAFVICNDGTVTVVAGSQAYVDRRLAGQPPGCAPYAINEQVVWKGQ